MQSPVDLRRTLATSILVTGGTAMLPGFIPRLHAELIRAIVNSPSTSARPPVSRGRPRPPAYDRYAVLRPLVPYFAILNNPSPTQPSGVRGSTNAGKAPAFTPATMAWVGGSLAGYVCHVICLIFASLDPGSPMTCLQRTKNRRRRSRARKVGRSRRPSRPRRFHRGK